MEAFTISEFTGLIKSTLQNEQAFRNCFLKGTITNLKRHSSGTYYLTLKDDKAAIDCAIFHNTARIKDFVKEMENGLLVTVRGSVNFYEPWGKLSFIISDMFIDRKSPLQIEFENLKKELTSLGYFSEEHKKPIPYMAKHIGMITSSSGSVRYDILNVAKNRNPLVTFTLYDVPVQGAYAAPYIAKAIQEADSNEDVELIIIARGGGSMEDLWCFNDRKVVEAIFHCHTPIISAVGHETDFTLCDFAADRRSSTPSHAAEEGVLPIQELLYKLEDKKQYITIRVMDSINKEKQKLMALFNRKILYPSLQSISQQKSAIKDLYYKMNRSYGDRIHKEEKTLALINQKIQLLNPLQFYLKGYTKIQCGDRAILSIKEIAKGDTIQMSLPDGLILAEIKEINDGKKISNI